MLRQDRVSCPAPPSRANAFVTLRYASRNSTADHRAVAITTYASPRRVAATFTELAQAI
jgi:hypothetical protein